MKLAILTIMALMIPAVSAGILKIYPSDDAFVRNRYPSNNYGISSNLRAGYNVNFGTDRSYLKFNLASLQGKTINSTIYSIDTVFYQNNPLVNLYLTSNNWNENTINWDNKPSQANLIDSKLVNSPDRIEFDVSPFISGNEVSFVMIEQNEDTDVQFFSKDLDTGQEGDEVYWPYLEVEYEGGSCNTDADVNCDGCVSLIEIVNLMSLYKSGQTNLSLIEIVNLMSRYKSGEITC